MRTFKRAAERGGAVVELAIGMLLVIPLVIYTAYLGEALMTSVKIQQAEITASWDITGYKIHDFDGKKVAGKDPEPQPDKVANNRIVVAKSSANRVMAEITNGALKSSFAVGAGALTDVSCTPIAAPNPGAAPFLTIPSMHNFHTRDWLSSGDGYVACAAQGQFIHRGVTRVDLAGKPKADLIPASALSLQMCGNGPGVSGCTKGKPVGISVLTDDWAVDEGQTNSLKSPVAPERKLSVNDQLYGLGQSLFLSYAANPATDRPLGAQKVRGVSSILTGVYQEMTEIGTYGNYAHDLSSFRLGMAGPLSGTRKVPSDNGTGVDIRLLHMLPWDDGEAVQAGTPAGLDPFVSGKDLYAHRADGHYLGHPNANFNLP